MLRFKSQICFTVVCTWLVAGSVRGQPPTETKPSAPIATGLRFATGFSAGKDLLVDGRTAAETAKKALNGQEAKLVFVSVVCPKEVKPEELLNGVYEVFDRAIVYGSCNSGIISKDGVQTTGVGVLAVGGNISVAASMADLAGKAADAGAKIGEDIKKANLPTDKTRLMLLVGNAHWPKNNDITKGVLSVLGESLPVIGSAADAPKHVFFQGKASENAAIGILLAGEFTCGFGMETATDKKDVAAVIAAAEKSAANAVAAKGKPDFVLAFDCGGRFRALNSAGKLGEELAAVKRSVGEAPIFGFYGQGEVGKKDAASVSFGNGYHISCCAIYLPKK